MQNKSIQKNVSLQMLRFEFRKTIGNPYVHIFGVGMPVLMMIIITRAVMSQVADQAIRAQANTSVFLGIGALIPMATIFMGYGVSNAQELEKGIPQRMELFGIKPGVTICNRILAEAIFMFLAFLIYFAVGYAAVDLVCAACGAALRLPAACPDDLDGLCARYTVTIPGRKA